MPIAGSGVAALMGLVGPKIAQRRDEWFELLADKISELESRVEGFAESPMFITAVIEATNAALKTHEREKLGALRNAVANSPLPGAPDESTQMMFLRFVDELTALHLRVLVILNDPNGSVERTGKGISRGTGLWLLIHHCMPEIPEIQIALLEQIHRELQSRGLVTQENFHGAIIDPDRTAKRTTPFGKEFLRFIN